jgi:hypothetical protein
MRRAPAPDRGKQRSNFFERECVRNRQVDHAERPRDDHRFEQRIYLDE